LGKRHTRKRVVDFYTRSGGAAKSRGAVNLVFILKVNFWLCIYIPRPYGMIGLATVMRKVLINCNAMLRPACSKPDLRFAQATPSVPGPNSWLTSVRRQYLCNLSAWGRRQIPSPRSGASWTPGLRAVPGRGTPMSAVLASLGDDAKGRSCRRKKNPVG
jgi:hypothetical protein